MMENFPDRALVRQAVSLAARAPSTRNSQPWSWKVGSRSIHLFVDDVGQTSGSGGDERDAITSCGIALQHMRIALSALGWRPVITRLPDPANPSHLAHIELEPRTGTVRDFALASAIPRRRTDRRTYATWPVPQGYLDLLELRCADEGVIARSTASPDHSGALIVVTTPDDDVSSRLRAGEATGVILLEATVLGLATCRLTELPRIPVMRGRPRLRVVAPHSVPQVLVKVGWPAANVDPLSPTPRRDVESMMQFDYATTTIGISA